MKEKHRAFENVYYVVFNAIKTLKINVSVDHSVAKILQQIANANVNVKQIVRS